LTEYDQTLGFDALLRTRWPRTFLGGMLSTQIELTTMLGSPHYIQIATFMNSGVMLHAVITVRDIHKLGLERLPSIHAGSYLSWTNESPPLLGHFRYQSI
jgi:hypothetical protein